MRRCVRPICQRVRLRVRLRQRRVRGQRVHCSERPELVDRIHPLQQSPRHASLREGEDVQTPRRPGVLVRGAAQQLRGLRRAQAGTGDAPASALGARVPGIHRPFRLGEAPERRRHHRVLPRAQQRE